MIRLLLFFVGLAILAYCGMWLVQHPGHVSLDWFGYQLQTSAALLIIVVAVLAVAGWVCLRVLFGLPSFFRLAARQRRREKGYAALSRGLVAVGSGDAYGASRASNKASRHLKDDTLALVLEAQAAHLNGNGAAAVRAFEALAHREDTHVLGLRGLYAEATRRGDDDAARHFAAAAYKAGPLPWSAHAVLEHRASDNDWEAALQTVEANVAARLVEGETGERQRAVLETAIAYDKEGTAPDTALALARAAMKRAPDLAPPVVLAARVLSRRGDIRKAAKLIEKAWPQCQHPDIAQAYLEVRPGDSTTDRLSRAKTLMGIASFDPVSRMLVARAALANTDYATARSAMAPLVAEGKRPTVRMCLQMAEIEEAEYGDIGQSREWLARASRASADPTWVADGTVYDHWSPVSPTTGKLDAFRWQVPAERQGAAIEALPPRQAALQRDPAPTTAAMPGQVALQPRDPALDSAATPAPQNLGLPLTESDQTSKTADDVAVSEASNGHVKPASPSAPMLASSTHPIHDDTALPGKPTTEAESEVVDERDTQISSPKAADAADAPAMTEAHIPPSANSRRGGTYTSG